MEKIKCNICGEETDHYMKHRIVCGIINPNGNPTDACLYDLTDVIRMMEQAIENAWTFERDRMATEVQAVINKTHIIPMRYRRHADDCELCKVPNKIRNDGFYVAGQEQEEFVTFDPPEDPETIKNYNRS